MLGILASARSVKSMASHSFGGIAHMGATFLVCLMTHGVQLFRLIQGVGSLANVLGGTKALEGFNLFTGIASPYNASVFIRLRPWSERTGRQGQSADEIRRAMALTLDRKAFNDIMIEGQGGIGAAMLPAPDGVWGCLCSSWESTSPRRWWSRRSRYCCRRN